jgi:solute carrier family 25 (mitochondrial phosphate transporter), member 23/24/25/41
MDDDTANAQDARVKALWSTLDTRKQGRLDLIALKRGLNTMGHRSYTRFTKLLEYTNLIVLVALSTADRLLQETMKAVDTNNDGHITFNGQPIDPSTALLHGRPIITVI